MTCRYTRADEKLKDTMLSVRDNLAKSYQNEAQPLRPLPCSALIQLPSEKTPWQKFKRWWNGWARNDP